jgi:hypothetical protein
MEKRMAITGNYLASVEYTGARKWGTGWNPVHAMQLDLVGGRESMAVPTLQGPNKPGPETLPPGLVNPLDTMPEYGYTDEDFSSQIWGYGPQTGTSDRPARDVPTEQYRFDTPTMYPGMGNEPGPPGGFAIRSEEHGDVAGSIAKLGDKEETVGEGWENKQLGTVEDATVSDPSQYEMQTSMTQRDKVRAGSQRGSGSASEFTAPIGSWRPTWGMRIKPWSGGRRHYDMTPRRQDVILRPFWFRQAGTGYQEWMLANEAYNYQVDPLQRQPVQDPYPGQEVPGNVYQDESNNWVEAWY